MLKAEEGLKKLGYAMFKNKRRKYKRWKTPESVLSENTLLTLDLYPYSGKYVYFMIANLSTDTIGLEFHEKKAEIVSALLNVWSESIGLKLHELTFLTGRGFCLYEGASQNFWLSSEANGNVQRRHKEIYMLCRLCDCDSSTVAEIWYIG